ncbi:MAG TPA: class I SAM-dependent rRNA methyltransferase [Burkholderiaceae bacterium]|jgi:23S rRNA (cytosine1962-C5)-methyltransferase|nr:class I SAM-dependent rRNA methyltransferase [Burkholderiaceae bacterium]
MHQLVLKPGKERSLARRHPWIYATAVARVAGAPAAGELIAVHGADGRWLAWAAFAPDSAIRARCWSFDQADRIDRPWLAARVREAVARRARLASHSNALRLVYGEADLLPGLIADRYHEQLVVQLQAPGVQAHRDDLLDALCQATGCRDVFDRSDSALRAREGLASGSGVLRGAEPAERIGIREHGLDYWVDVRRGHKTGFYIDQRDNRRLAGELARELATTLGRAPRALNAFCYTGAFSVALARGGACDVLSVDSSADALALGRSNAELNGIGLEAIQWRCADVFEQLRACREAGERFDLVVLDPPKFAASHHQVDRAARAYKDINLNALRLLQPGGMLLTFSCSGAIDVDLFQKIVAGAVIDAGVDCVMRARLGPGTDHPMLMTHPEGEYLKGLLLQRL